MRENLCFYFTVIRPLSSKENVEWSRAWRDSWPGPSSHSSLFVSTRDNYWGYLNCFLAAVSSLLSFSWSRLGQRYLHRISELFSPTLPTKTEHSFLSVPGTDQISSIVSLVQTRPQLHNLDNYLGYLNCFQAQKG